MKVSKRIVSGLISKALLELQMVHMFKLKCQQRMWLTIHADMDIHLRTYCSCLYGIVLACMALHNFICTQKHIVLACMALHDFIRDSRLRDEKFDRCDADEDYLLEETSATTQDENQDGENEVTMNIIRDRIADALVNARER
ncbi:transposon protein, putative, CACTA, En/Spm sub-class [Panicum miliaceum]|uniref:Transposon protein, putative, CACTA, En/Spm sub-class n=1 Tax=Panicum miliaceum TaxID=4540 RepID=A0A3L6T7K1_PANMI|nr:transposon protein, putative, CACTA, En/Spm sub-class [Panicum miliaceum]